jgi:hypothetical protein
MVFDAIREVIRENTPPGDVKFLQDLIYYFELQVPSTQTLGLGGTFMFPLVLGPESYDLDEPFALAKTPTQGSGLYVEENGIIERTLRLRGHTGWKPRPFQGTAGFSLIQPPPAGRSFVRGLLDPIEDISGQKHFQFLQDAVFRTYADFKRDPTTSEDTKLLFHIPKEDEHWEVKPVHFHLSRTLEKRTLYYYDIELLIVGPAQDPAFNVSEDKNLLDTLKSVAVMIQSGIDLVKSAITDITGLVNDIQKAVAGIGALINDVVGIVDAASDFVNGVTEVIKAPFGVIASVTNRIADAINGLITAGSNLLKVPDAVHNLLRQAQDGLDRIGSFPSVFQTDSQRALEAARNGEELSTSKSQATLRAAAATQPPNSFQKLIALGTANTPGDLQRSRSELKISKALAAYNSTDERHLGKSDTLQSLAAKYLGDARLWRHIAVLNNLQFPFISDEGIPGTKTVGDKILIPSKAKPPENRVLVPVLGVEPSAPADERVFGTDFALERVAGPGDLFDIPIDVEGGSVDVKVVRGVDNLTQGILSRLRTERGTDQLYKNVGVDRIVGLPIPALGPQIVGIRVGQAVKADPRIVGIKSLSITQPSPDAVEVEFDAQVIGISGTTPINLTF